MFIQLKEIAAKIPPEVCENLKAIQTQVLASIEAIDSEAAESQASSTGGLDAADKILQNENNAVKEGTSTKGKLITLESAEIGNLSQAGENVAQGGSETTSSNAIATLATEGPEDDVQDSSRLPSDVSESSKLQSAESEASEEPKSYSSSDADVVPNQRKENVAMPPQASTTRIEGARESIEQFEPGVYVTFIQLHNGTKVFRRVRFR